MAGHGKVAMIGDGNAGSALSQGLKRAGYEVQAVGKEPAKVHDLAHWGEIIVLAVPFSERENALREMGDGIAEKTLVDVTNALKGRGNMPRVSIRAEPSNCRRWPAMRRS